MTDFKLLPALLENRPFQTDVFQDTEVTMAQLESAVSNKFIEKPTSWEELDQSRGGYTPWTLESIARAEDEFGIVIKRFTPIELFGNGDHKPSGPLADLVKSSSQYGVEYGIVKFADDTEYIFDLTWANTYIRMWARVV